MQLENIEEDQEKFWNEPTSKNPEKYLRESSEVPGQKQVVPVEQRRGSNLLSAAGIDFEKRRRQQSGSIGGGSGGHGEARIFQEGNQWMEEKDGKVTKLELIEVKEKMGRMRRAVPLLPVPIAILLCIFNVLLPSVGTFIGAITLLCGAKCRHKTTAQGIKYGILAGMLQLLLTPLLVGWIFSMYYGANIVQDAIERSDPKEVKSAAKKIVIAVYIYSCSVFFIALNTMDTNPKYPFSLLGIRGVARWKLIPFALFEAYASYHAASMILLCCIFFPCYVKCTAICLKLQYDQSLHSTVKNYRILQVLNNRFNVCFQTSVIPFILILVLGVNVVSNYASIRLHSYIKLSGVLGFSMTSIATTLIAVDTIPPSYRLYEGSEKLVRKMMETALRNGFHKKFLRGCKPLSIRVGSYFAIKQITFMTFMKIIIDNAIMLLLTF